MAMARRVRRGGRLPRGSEPEFLEVEIDAEFAETVNHLGDLARRMYKELHDNIALVAEILEVEPDDAGDLLYTYCEESQDQPFLVWLLARSSVQGGS